MSTAVDNFKSNISLYKNNPIGIARAAMELLSDAANIDIVDPTSPFVMLVEAGAILTASAISENQALNRKQYPFAAQTEDDLYIHMSDKDYANRFAVPCTAKILFMIDKTQLLNVMVLDQSTGIRKVVIPRNTKTVVASTTFSLQYPVEIRQMAHGGLQVVYNAEEVSPLYTLESNLVTWSFVKDDSGNEYLAFEVLMHQFNIITRTEPVSVSTAFSLAVNLSDQYYYCRVYIDNGDRTYTEISTTHTDEIYDPLSPTAVLKVVDQTVNIKIPLVYVDSGLAGKTVRVDVYETKGPVDLNLNNYTQEQFVTTFLSINAYQQDEYVAALAGLRTVFVVSRSLTQGGSNGMTFTELRTRVIQNAIGSPSLPITNVQIESTLERNGYRIVKNIDVVTNRVFLASRTMPDPSTSNLLTAASAGIGTLSVKASEAVAIDTVVDNESLITITPNTIYRLINGILTLVPSSELTYLRALPVDQQALVVTNGSYFYSPFHYVMDSSSNEFDLRAYYLDNPQIAARSFIAENDTTLLQVSTGTSAIVRTSTGYQLQISTSSSDDWKALNDADCHVQLAIYPTGDTTPAYVLGVQAGRTATGNERIYTFDLSSNFSVDSDDELSMTTLTQFNNTERIVKVPLEGTYEILYSTNASVGSQWRVSTIDQLLGGYQLPSNTKAITHEQMKLHFGDALKTLWARSRTVISEEQYQRWTVDVPLLYSQDVYQRDNVTGAAFTIVNGNLVYNKIHSAGDPQLDSNGDPRYKARAGDIKLDNYGHPIVVSTRDLLRQMDIFLLEGSYFFATDSITASYKTELVTKVVSWLTDDLPTMGSDLLEQTLMYYYPTTTIGNVKVTVNNGIIVTLNAGQAFSLKLSVRDSVFKNLTLRDAIEKKTVRTISGALNNPIVATSDIIDLLRTQYKTDVVGISLTGLGGSKNYDVVIMNDDSNRLSIRKRLVADSDGSLRLEEDVTIEFVNLDSKVN